jgi:hypothetical protein
VDDLWPATTITMPPKIFFKFCCLFCGGGRKKRRTLMLLPFCYLLSLHWEFKHKCVAFLNFSFPSFLLAQRVMYYRRWSTSILEILTASCASLGGHSTREKVVNNNNNNNKKERCCCYCWGGVVSKQILTRHDNMADASVGSRRINETSQPVVA